MKYHGLVIQARDNPKCHYRFWWDPESKSYQCHSASKFFPASYNDQRIQDLLQTYYRAIKYQNHTCCNLCNHLGPEKIEKDLNSRTK